MWYHALLVYALMNSCQASSDDSNLWPVREFRGMWVATVSNIDWPDSPHDSPLKQQQDLEALVDKSHLMNFNAIVFQVRTSGEAFYNSSLEPWSQYLTGSQGTAPSPFYDPLEFLIEKAHVMGIEVHAWFNPYRAHAGSPSLSGLAGNHMARRFPQYAYPYGNILWMDPGAHVVQDHISAVFLDVVRRYDVDGIHMDDYFYPYPIAGRPFPDSDTYNTYRSGGGTLGLSDWRRHNVDTLVQRLNTEIHSLKSFVKFGISPFGIWKPGYPSGIHGLSAYDELYADSKKWIEEGWVDYLAPQLYWQIDPPQQSYPALLKWWLQQNPHKHHIYTGNYASRWGVPEIVKQVRISRDLKSNFSLGNIQFSMQPFTSNHNNIADAFRTSLYQQPAIVPEMSWLKAPAPAKPTDVKVTGNTVMWSNGPLVSYWTVYKYEADIWNLINVLYKNITSVSGLKPGSYAIRSLNRVGAESGQVNFVINATISVVIG